VRGWAGADDDDLGVHASYGEFGDWEVGRLCRSGTFCAGEEGGADDGDAERGA